MTEREWLYQLLDDVQYFFATEGLGPEHEEAFQAMAKTVNGLLAAREEDDFDHET